MSFDTSWGVWDYPDPPKEDPPPTCDECDENIGDWYEVDGYKLCADCFVKYLKDIGLAVVADALGYDHGTYD